MAPWHSNMDSTREGDGCADEPPGPDIQSHLGIKGPASISNPIKRPYQNRSPEWPYQAAKWNDQMEWPMARWNGQIGQPN